MSPVPTMRKERLEPRALRGSTWRAATLAGLLLAASGLTGCSMPLLHQGGDLVARKPAPGTVSTPERPSALEPHVQTARHPDEPYWPYRNAVQELDADSAQAAESMLLLSIKRDPTYAPALALLSKLYFDSGRHAEAVQLLDRVRSHPEDFSNDSRRALLAGLALHEEALGRADEAGAAITQLPRRDLKSAASAAVFVTLRGDHPDSASDLVNATMREDSENAVNLNNYGITRLRAGDPEAARLAFEAASKRDPSLPGPYYNLTILEKFYLFDDAAAQAHFAQYWKLSHDDPDSLRAALAPVVAKPARAKGGKP